MAPAPVAGPEPERQRYVAVGSIVCNKKDLDDTMRPYSKLLEHKWVRFEPAACTDDDQVAITRVHVLPDDSCNCLIARDDAVLRSKKRNLLASLDYSPVTWRGLANHDAPLGFPLLSPAAHAARRRLADGRDLSLLSMFNTIPSPSPDTNLVEDGVARESMSNLLSSTVQGLKTDLYPYQCRSAALMLQKEEQLGQVLDPRLVQVLGQDGGVWYYNPVTGETLREPRHYDRVCGGILAEEMGSGKTLICLALIAATKHQPAVVPELYRGGNITTRPSVGSLMDMAAAVATKNGVAWRRYIGPQYEKCVRAIHRNPGWYYLPRPESRRPSRRAEPETPPPTKVFVTNATLILVPPNLLKQWDQEISKHMRGLQVLKMATKQGRKMASDEDPPVSELTRCDIVICTVARLEKMWSRHKRPEADGSYSLDCSLGQVQFKRCIVDEGHRLGNIKLHGVKTTLLLVLDALHINARWIVTGTPAKGLFGMDKNSDANTSLAESSAAQEREDLERIGSIATFYLKARPWSNTVHEHGDSPADWKTYVIQGRKDCLASTFDSLIIRHRLSEISHMLPAVDSSIVKLEGSYQDQLCLGLFSMMIIFNAVSSQRTDQDYFFHPRNRKSLLQLVSNLRQTCFFGGSFFSVAEIQRSVETAEDFLEKRRVPISAADEALLKTAIGLGKVAAKNSLKRGANDFHEVPICVEHFPLGHSAAWSVEEGSSGDGPLCTNWKLMMAAQKSLRPYLGSTQDLNTYLNSGAFARRAISERTQFLLDAQSLQSSSVGHKPEATLAGNTKLGKDHVSPRKGHSAAMEPSEEGIPTPPPTPEQGVEIAAPLAQTRLVATASAKLSYLIDGIVTYQKEEQIIVFYENDNVAWYLAGVLEMLQIQHLIYAKGISAERRAQYVSTFTHGSSRFRVLLMDMSEAAFGLDMRSASRVYFTSPVLDPQVEAQAIGRVRRISQRKRVTVETLVLRGSIEEVIVARRLSMTQAEHRSCRTILDDRPIYDWILSAGISAALPELGNSAAQMAPLAGPLYIFGREFGRELAHPDEDILLQDPPHPPTAAAAAADVPDKTRAKRTLADLEAQPDCPTARPAGSTGTLFRAPARPVGRPAEPGEEAAPETPSSPTQPQPAEPAPPARPAKRARFADF